MSNDAAIVDHQRALVQGVMDRTGLSLSSLATAASISPSTLTRWWRERNVLRTETIAKILAVSPEPAESGLDRSNLVEAISISLEVTGLSPDRARPVAAAAALIYRRMASGENFDSRDDARKAAALAIEVAEQM